MTGAELPSGIAFRNSWSQNHCPVKWQNDGGRTINRKHKRFLSFCPHRSAKVRMIERRRVSKDSEEMGGQV